MKLCVLASGSKGNAIYIESRGTALIIDQGLTHKRLAERLDQRGLHPDSISAILVSHDHSDHVGGVGVSARRLKVPVYATEGSYSRIQSLFDGSETLHTISGGVPFEIGPFTIHPFSIPHDAIEPVQFCISSGRRKIAVATDIGFASTLIMERIRDVDALVIESNYDIDMLKNGPYPWQLKQRIMSKTGHLSNRNASELIFNLSKNGSLKVVLAHLSEENNLPELAERTIRELFEKYDRTIKHLYIASQHEPTPVIEL